jgi:hypothetical protein
MMETKVCITCGSEKPSGEFYYGRRTCKECLNRRSREQHIKSDRKKELDDLFTQGLKKCTKCGEIKDVEQFRLTKKRGKYVRRSRCLNCEREDGKDWIKRNPEKAVASRKRWREENREHELEYSRNYEEEHKEERREKCRRYSKDHPEVFREKARNRRARERNVRQQYTKGQEAITMEAFGGRCFLCGSDEDLCVDHNYPLVEGFALTIFNAVILCNVCNGSKGPKFPEEFYTKEKMSELTTIFDGIKAKYPDLTPEILIRPEKSNEPITHKICTKCDQDKPIEEFKLIKKRGKQCRRSECIICSRKAFIDWYNRNKAKKQNHTKEG